MATRQLVRNATVFDSAAGRLRPGCQIVIEGERIAAVSEQALQVDDAARIIDAGGRVVLPGLIFVWEWWRGDGAATAKPGAHVGGYDTVHGAPLMAAWVPSRAGRVVTLNMYPPSGALRADFWDPASDGITTVRWKETGGPPVEQFDAADLDDAVAVVG